METTLKFKKNETFYIRDGWFEKAINTIKENPKINIFAKTNGSLYLGIGTNMVKGLRYWLQASKIIESTSKSTSLSSFGNLLYQYDKYLESTFSWFLIHFFLCTDEIQVPVFYGAFNNDLKTFTKNDMVNCLAEIFSIDGYTAKKEYIDDDVGVFLKSYLAEDTIENPEDNYCCPLANLKLLSKSKEKYIKTRPSYSLLSYLIVYFALASRYDFEPFNIEDSIFDLKAPCSLFNLDKNSYLQYLDEAKRNGLITINKTAGLNTVYFDKKLDLKDLFSEYFGG